MATITIERLCFSYENESPLFCDVSLEISTRWKLGLIGRNGRGKTTLLKLLHGELEHEGRIHCPVEVDLFPFPPASEKETVRDFLEKTAEFEPWELERELSLLEVSEEALDRSFETLSGGEKTKLLLASLFLRKERFLLIDEPTNHLDLQGRDIVSRYLRRKEGFLLVSHDRRFLDGCIDHILSLNRNGVEVMQGNFSTWNQAREFQERFEQAEDRRLQKEVKRLKDAAKKASGWSRKAEKEKYGNGPVDRGFLGSKAAKMMKRSQSTAARQQKALEEKTKLFKNRETEEPLLIRPLAFHRRELVELRDLAVRYGEKTVLENFSLSIFQGERIALCGPNGCGKSSLLKRILGGITENNPGFSGTCRIAGGLKISCLPQEDSRLRGTIPGLIQQRDLDATIFNSYLFKLGLSRDHFEKDLGELSAGERKKVLLAATLSEQAHLYLWDEPLNYIDVISRMQIEQLILQYAPTLLFVEHDRDFLETVATKIVEL